MYIIWLYGHHDVGALGTRAVDCNIAIANSLRTVRISEDLRHGFVFFEMLDDCRLYWSRSVHRTKE